MNLVERTHGILTENGALWSIGGKLQNPTKDDVGKVLDMLYRVVYDGEEQMQAETGGILVKKDEGHIDVYIHIGEYNDDSS